MPYVCPHCSHDLFVCFGFMPPGLSWIIPAEEMARNKDQLKSLLNDVKFASEEERTETYKWIDSDDCVLGAEDIEDVAKMIVQEQREKDK